MGTWPPTDLLQHLIKVYTVLNCKLQLCMLEHFVGAACLTSSHQVLPSSALAYGSVDICLSKP